MRVRDSLARSGEGAAESHPGTCTTEPAPSWREALRVGLGIWLLTRMAFFVFALGAMQVAPTHDLVGKVPGWPARLYYSFDSLNFYSVAVSGYTSSAHPTAATNNPAFFPGYPLLARIVAMPFGGLHPSGAPIYWSLALIAWIGAAVAAVVIWRLAAEQAGRAAATRAVVLLLAGPYAVFLMASYSEGVFLAFAISAWYAGRRRQWWLAGVLGAAASLARINGLCLGAGLVAMYVLQRLQDGKRSVGSDAAALGLPFFGIFGYFAWLRLHTGSWRAWFNAQDHWHRKFTWPWDSLYRTIQYIEHPRGARMIPALELLFAVLAVTVLIALLVWHKWPEAIYVAITIASMTTSNWFLSLPRLCLMLFPGFIVLAAWSTRARWRWPGLISASITLLAVNSLTLLYGQWVA